MDSDLWLASGTPPEAAGREADAPRLPSRLAALKSLRDAIARRAGPVVLAGEPGSGKTTLVGLLAAERAEGVAWARIEVGPGTTAGDLYRLIARELRVDPAGFGRPELFDHLAECSLESGPRALAIDEAQNLDPTTLEEVRVLSNRIGRDDGFAAIVLVGQTRLTTRLRGHAAAAWRARMVETVMLRRLDADEAGELLKTLDPQRDWPVELVDRIQALAEGQPARIVALGRRAIERSAPAPAIAAGRPADPVEPRRSEPLVGPARPPIRVEDGLIEVGWEPESDFERHEPASILDPVGPYDEEAREGVDESDVEAETEGEERINDHYAALQAWQEWAKNQGRLPDGEAARPGNPAPAAVPTALDATPSVWADEEHGFAPFGRLFTRIAQENEAD